MRPWKSEHGVIVKQTTFCLGAPARNLASPVQLPRCELACPCLKRVLRHVWCRNLLFTLLLAVFAVWEYFIEVVFRFRKAYTDYRHAVYLDQTLDVAHQGLNRWIPFCHERRTLNTLPIACWVSIVELNAPMRSGWFLMLPLCAVSRCAKILQQMDGPNWREKVPPMKLLSPPAFMLSSSSKHRCARVVYRSFWVLNEFAREELRFCFWVVSWILEYKRKGMF